MPVRSQGRTKTNRRRAAKMSVEDEIAHLRGLSLTGLRARWLSETGASAPSHLPRHLLFAMLAYRLQADAWGDLNQATLRLLARAGTSVARGAVEVLTAEHDRHHRDLPPGAVLTRQWNDRICRVMVMESGFAYEGRRYDSLSAIAHAITGTRWNGPRFFGLRDAPPRKEVIGNASASSSGKRGAKSVEASRHG